MIKTAIHYTTGFMEIAVTNPEELKTVPCGNNQQEVIKYEDIPAV